MNFLELKNKVKDYLNREDLVSQIPDFINMALKKIEWENNFNYMVNSTSGPLSKGNESIAIPSNMKSVINLKIKDITSATDNGVTLTAVGYDYLQRATPNISEGKPDMFAIYGDYIWFNKKVDESSKYQYELDYYKFSDELSGDTDSNWLTINAYQVLLYGALLEAEAYLINDERIMVWKGLYEDALHKLRKSEVEKIRPRIWIIRNGVNV